MSRAATSRLLSEYRKLQKDPAEYITAQPLENNVLEWHTNTYTQVRVEQCALMASRKYVYPGVRTIKIQFSVTFCDTLSALCGQVLAKIPACVTKACPPKYPLV